MLVVTRLFLIRVHCFQCDQIGRFLKVLGEKFSHKKPKYIVTFGATMKTVLFRQQLLLILFGQLCEKFGLLFILTPGHADCLSISMLFLNLYFLFITS